MEVAVSPAVVQSMLLQLKHRNKLCTDAFQDVVADYQSCLLRSRELQVRNAQLDKEASEVRLENEHLLYSLEEAKRDAVHSAQHAALEAKAQQLQEELTAAYRERAGLAEASMQATNQLQVVREINQRQAKELADAAEKVKELKGQLEYYREAHSTVSTELQTRLAEAQEAAARADKLEGENAELARRLIGLKEAEAERMNELNDLREEAVRELAKARQQADAMRAEAKALAAAAGPRGAGADTAAAVAAALSGLGMGDDAEAERPAVLLKSVPAHPGGCFGLAFSRTGALLASGGADKSVKLWEPATATPTSTLHGAFEGINAVAFTSDAKLVLAAENKKAVRVWDVATGRLRISLTGHTDRVTGVACSPADALVAATCSADRTIKLWGLEKGYCLRDLVFPSSCTALALSADGALLASGHFNGTLRFWDVRSGKQAYELLGLHSQQITSVDVGLSGRLALTCGKDNQLRCVDMRRFEVRHTLSAPAFTVGGPWAAACLSPGESQAAAPGSDGTLYVWDLAKSAVVARLRDGKQNQPGVACAWCPLGLPLVAGDKAGVLTFWTGGSGGGQAAASPRSPGLR